MDTKVTSFISSPFPAGQQFRLEEDRNKTRLRKGMFMITDQNLSSAVVQIYAVTPQRKEAILEDCLSNIE